MKEGKASWTAEGVAFYRALESMLPEDERACYDPLAKEFGTWFSSILRNPIRTKIARLYIERGGLAPSYFSLIARTAYIDNCLRECIEDGIEQLVILGAGFESRAYRFDGLRTKVGSSRWTTRPTQR